MQFPLIQPQRFHGSLESGRLLIFNTVVVAQLVCRVVVRTPRPAHRLVLVCANKINGCSVLVGVSHFGYYL